MTAGFERGDVVWHPAPYKDDPDAGRPFVILSDEYHPYHGEEYIVVALTTVSRPQALPLADTDWTRGGTLRDSYVSPWYVMSLKGANFDAGVGQLRDTTVDRIASEIGAYVGADSR
ncbi:type II toxin-antitoxin system PemK/MazF family toxin [Halorarum halobium]|uniref:type II toxin-antitoxin system PemK/MazF family toxin n=1 Tax=Halorarum halobium TaxID=3075121 RepID=UPI0028A69A1A|nr:type II toxin-antitoxin system PemK/MazF family toxin [Halobaculum sp. XH14]